MTKQTSILLIEQQEPTSCTHTVDELMEQLVNLSSLTQTTQAPGVLNPQALAA